jgi:putative transposase
VSRATVERRRTPPPRIPKAPPATRALAETEKQRVVAALCSERFVDRSPAEVVHTLLDEGEYLCSERTMYRCTACSPREAP